MVEFIRFKTFSEETSLQYTTDILDENEISYLIEDGTTSGYVGVQIGVPATKILFLKLQRKDFIKATEMLRESITKQLSRLPNDYYLYSFDDEELWEIIQQPDNWSEIDYELAKKLLIEKGHKVDNTTLERLEKDRLIVLSQPQTSSFTLLGMALLSLPVFYGAVIALEIATTKKSLPNGESVYMYDENSRMYGKILIGVFIVGVILVIIARASH